MVALRHHDCCRAPTHHHPTLCQSSIEPTGSTDAGNLLGVFGACDFFASRMAFHALRHLRCQQRSLLRTHYRGLHLLPLALHPQRICQDARHGGRGQSRGAGLRVMKKSDGWSSGTRQTCSHVRSCFMSLSLSLSVSLSFFFLSSLSLSLSRSLALFLSLSFWISSYLSIYLAIFYLSICLPIYLFCIPIYVQCFVSLVLPSIHPYILASLASPTFQQV